MGENLTLPFAVFNLYEQRVAERTAYARDLLKKGFDFSKDESYMYQREKAPWPKTEADLNELWRQRTKNDWLRLKLAGKKDADIRNVLERASARETAARVAAGSIARGFLAALGVSVHSHVLRIASVEATELGELTPESFAAVDESPVRCLDPKAEAAMIAEIDRLRKANESLGGIFEVRAFGLVPGLGSHVAWDEKLDGRLAHAIVSIQAVKGVSVGEAWEVAASPGSESHD